VSRRLKVVQWTTGKTGSAAVRGMVGHPVIDLVGCFAYSDDKVGRDVGELCGIDPIGVIATDDVEALLALRPDCVSYMAYRPDFDHLERILESGTNVVATMYMLAGHGYGEEPTRRLREACLRGGTSLYASGIYPGHAAMVAMSASAMCSRVERLSILESLDIQGYANEQMFRAQGFDLDPSDPAAYAACEASCGSFKEQVPVIAKAMDTEIDRVGFRVEFGIADADTDFGFMSVQKGRIAAFKGTVFGEKDGRSIIECSFVWKLGHPRLRDRARRGARCAGPTRAPGRPPRRHGDHRDAGGERHPVGVRGPAGDREPDGPALRPCRRAVPFLSVSAPSPVRPSWSRGSASRSTRSGAGSATGRPPGRTRRGSGRSGRGRSR
jgi:hypothetical protein